MHRKRLIEFDNWSLLPAPWRRSAGDGPIWAFNPAILKTGSGWLFAYRIVLQDQRRRIAICRLDSDFQVVSGSSVPLSDLIAVGTSTAHPEPDRTWLADPRLYCLSSRLWIYWNSGWHDGPNAQFLQEIDSETLRPVGEPLLIERDGVRQTIEKNWMLFGSRLIHAVYSPAEQSILEACLKTKGRELRFREAFQTPWDSQPYTSFFGALRGGAPPVLLNGTYYSVCHSVYGTPGSYRYIASIYRFSAEPPFAVSHRPISPLPLPTREKRINPVLNPAIQQVIYPAGAAFEKGNWVISYGVNDELCAVAILPHEEVEACMAPL